MLHLLAFFLSLGAVILIDPFTNSLDYSGCYSLTATACFHPCFPEIFETNGETVLIHDDQIIFRLSNQVCTSRSARTLLVSFSQTTINIGFTRRTSRSSLNSAVMA